MSRRLFLLFLLTLSLLLPLTAAAGDWRRTVDSVMIDFHSDGEVFAPTLLDVPEKNALVRGIYALPADASRIRARITDLFAECTEFEIRV